jgi:arsenical pump membrane protein
MHAVVSSAGQAWPPFVLVAGLLLIGSAAGADGLFEALGVRVSRSRLGSTSLLLALLALDAAVTAVLNLDTSVVFLTPVLIHAARRRQLDERPFLYGSVFMANAASLLLPGSNLTNLLVLRSDPQSGLSFAARMLPAWLVACTITAAFFAVAYRLEDSHADQGEVPGLRLQVGAVATVAAAALVLALPNPALPVLGVGAAAVALQRAQPNLNARSLVALFALTVALGSLARLWSGLTDLVSSGGAWTAAGFGAVASVLVNNLPAAVVLSSRPPSHPHALLLGLDLGPNLAVTGSLSAVLWLQTSRLLDAHASVMTYSRLGLALVPPTLAAALITMSIAQL